MIPYNFGLEGYLGIILYSTMWIALLFTIFKSPVYGLFYLAPLIPIQTIRYRLNEYPFGSSLIAIMMIGMLIGMARKREWIKPTPWTWMLLSYLGFTFVSVCLGALYFHEDPFAFWGSPRFAEWRDYASMIGLLFFTAATVKTKKQVFILLALMCFGSYALDRSFWSTVSERDFSTYSDDLRDEGAMGYAGVNGLAAFEAQFGILLLVLAHYEERWKVRIGYLVLAGFSVVCLMYSLSRGGYIAFALGFLFVAVVKIRRLLLIPVLFALTWTAFVPNAVRDRVLMTDQGDGELDHSSQTRIALWDDALEVFKSSPIIGTGFGTYAYMERVGQYRDTHNIFIKVLVETGVVGMAFFLLLLGRLWWAGFKLFREAVEPQNAALGLGLAAWVVCAAAANVFGDRWTFLQVNGYMWILAGLVARAYFVEEHGTDEDDDGEEEDEEETGEPAPSDSTVLAPA